jgi:CRISPR/Cas system-associated exonuclease Cas4 (RecB family)
VSREKVAAAAARRKAKFRAVKEASASSGWIKDAVTSTAHPIIAEMRQWLVDSNAFQSQSRDTEHIHPSEMAKSRWCTRQTWYRISGVAPTDPTETSYWRLANIFGEGHEIHARHQTMFWEMGVLEGMWGCMHCEHRWWAISPAVCERCSSAHIQYREVPIRHPAYHLIGHTDGLHASEENGVLVRRNLEMKSIGVRSIEYEVPSVYAKWKEAGTSIDALWANIRVPFPSHQRQVQLYMATLNHMGIEVKETLFVYEFKANQDIKGFVVKYNPDAAQKLLDQAKKVLDARNSGVSPKRPHWATAPSVKDCKECPWKTKCWGNNGDAENAQATG